MMKNNISKIQSNKKQKRGVERCVVYCRVSTSKEKQQPSNSKQKKACLRFARERNIVIMRRYEDVCPGSKEDRTGLKEMMSYILTKARKKIKYILVYSVDRFTRFKPERYWEINNGLAEKGISILYVMGNIDDTEKGHSREVRAVNKAWEENRRRRRRTIKKVAESLNEGRVCSRAPIGYKNAKFKFMPSLEIDPERAPFVKRAFEMVGRENYSVKGALIELTEQGFRTRDGKPVSLQNFGNMLRRIKYCGILNIPSKELQKEGDFEAIISKELFDLTQKVLKSRKRNRQKLKIRKVVA